jgi:hypothetical protein
MKYQNVQYYPAYEIMNDDLRDYRFYKEDMIHPTGQAIDYIWEHFTSSFFTPECQSFVQKWQKIRQALAHKPFNPSTSNHQKFLNQLLADLNLLSEQRDVSKEIALVKDQIL